MTTSTQPPATVASFRYERTRAVVRLVEPVTPHSIIALCDEVDAAIEYYQYDHVEIQLDSPGGHVNALEYYLSRLSEWRATPGVTIATLALTSVASAAAVILSLGDVGHRRAYASSQLLYHDARLVLPERSAMTRADMTELQASLAETDERIVRSLAAHAWGGVVPGEGGARRMTPVLEGRVGAGARGELRSEEDLRQEYARLFALDLPLRAESALALHLIDEVL